MVGLAPKWVRFAPNGINPGLFQIRFQCIWRPRVKCTEIWSEKAQDLSNKGSNLTHFGAKWTIPAVYKTPVHPCAPQTLRQSPATPRLTSRPGGRTATCQDGQEGRCQCRRTGTAWGRRSSWDKLTVSQRSTTGQSTEDLSENCQFECQKIVINLNFFQKHCQKL